MKKQFVKPILVLALGLAVVAPGVQNVYAAAPSTSETVKSEAQKAYEDMVKKAEDKLKELKDAKATIAYINASEKNQRVHDNNIKNLSDTLDYVKARIKSVTKVSDEDYKSHTAYINTQLQVVEESIKLDGVVVDKTALEDMFRNHSNFTTTEAYKEAFNKADRTLINNYNAAIEQASQAIIKGNNLSNAEYAKAYNDLKNAIDAINGPHDHKAALDAIKAEVEISDKIDQKLYTDKTVRTFKAALEAAHTTANIPSSTTQQLKEATETLRAAREALVKKPTNEDEKREQELKELRKALEKNETMARAGELLLNKYPETVKKIRPELEKLIETSKELSKKTQALIEKLENAPRG